MEIKVFCKLDVNVEKPIYKTEYASGCDLHAMESMTLAPGEQYLFKTGIYLEIPQGYEGQIRSRSGLAHKKGVVVLNSPGTIDSDYRGEIKVLLYNSDSEFAHINIGDRIAQLVFAPVIRAKFQIKEELTETGRGDGGFGSTGV